ncbi:MAG: bifunctional pyr operon transcriptional regulator/uracil phosphoribosyltransferase PyrR [Hahellaceae bacterium]|nr:bifunctional pyr operon transcriptional regulator/uracil phosphoribosyltransferase PyrR [Hahellaceae bacterium]MCP5169316.1 bifunctional pyr operon transcriptional regulator/uracil phosphoribosyltransferase PyrR [Hahellaceae bacterium]
MTSEINIEQLLDEMTIKLQALLRQREIVDPCLVGIRTGGVWLAELLRKKMSMSEALGELDISFYRDDFTRVGLNPTVKPSRLPFETDGRHVILIDDVIMSGRTIRAAMNELFDYGRPASITLVTLIDLGGRELPVQADVVGKKLELARDQRVKLKGPQPLTLEVSTKVN